MKIWKSSISSPTHIPGKPLSRLVTQCGSDFIKTVLPRLEFTRYIRYLIFQSSICKIHVLEETTVAHDVWKDRCSVLGTWHFQQGLGRKKSWTFHFVHYTIHFVIHCYRVDILSITIAIAENTKKMSNLVFDVTEQRATL